MRLATLAGPLEIGVDYWRTLPASKLDQAVPQFCNPLYPQNVGDWCLTKIVDRLLDYDELILIHRGADQRQWDEVNATCDALVLRGGNYLQPDFLSTAVGAEALLKVKIPIILFGAGIQDVQAGGVPFTEDEIRVLRHIHDSCDFSSVRGHVSAEVLASIGIHNTIVTGCPTVFWNREPHLTIRRPSDDLGRAAFSYRQFLNTVDVKAYRAQFNAIDVMRRRARELVTILQGEEVSLQQLHMARRWHSEFKVGITYGPGRTMHLTRERIDEGRLCSNVHSQLDRYAEPELIDWMIDHSFFSWDISDYFDLYGTCEMLVGCRFHSNLLALANGTPAFYLTYDQRTEELVELLEIPSCPLREFDESIDVVDQRWDRFEAAYERQYREMNRFLDANLLGHRLMLPQASEVEQLSV